MITIIFIAEDGQPVQLSFSRNEDLNDTNKYGTWNTNDNTIELNDAGWQYFQTYRKEVRKLKPLLDQLQKLPVNIEN